MLELILDEIGWDVFKFELKDLGSVVVQKSERTEEENRVVG